MESKSQNGLAQHPEQTSIITWTGSIEQEYYEACMGVDARYLGTQKLLLRIRAQFTRNVIRLNCLQHMLST